MFIVFEGIDGSGKSTQSNLLYQALLKKGYDVIHTRPEHDSENQIIVDSPIMTDIKAITHNTDYKDALADESELLLYMSQIAQMRHEIIKPALEQGKIVISDRYIYSLYAYFIYGKKLASNFVTQLGDWVTHDILPDQVILTDLPAQTAFDRKAEHNKPLGRKELLGPQFFEKIRNGFLDMASKDDKPWLIIDNKKNDKDTMHTQILNHITHNVIRDT